MDMTKEVFEYYFVDTDHNSCDMYTLTNAFVYGGYNLTGFEISIMLDMKQHYIFSKLKDNMDYVICPKSSTAVFKLPVRENMAKSLKQIYFSIPHQATTKEENDLYIKKLIRTKIFFQRHSFISYLNRDLYITKRTRKIELDKKEIPKNITNKDIKDIISNLKFYIKNYEPPFNYTTEIAKGNIKLKSLATIKKELEELMESPVYDSQIYRWLENGSEYVRFELRTISDSNPVVRYLIDINGFKEKKNNKYTYYIDTRQWTPTIEEDIIKKLKTISNEKKRK